MSQLVVNDSAFDDIRLVKKSLTKRLLRTNPSALKKNHYLAGVAGFAKSHSVSNVHAVGLGIKQTAGKPVGGLCIRFYVAKKLPKSVLGTSVLPPHVDGIPTDIIESKPAMISNCSHDRKSSVRPLVAGIGIGHVNISTGTLGYFCCSVDSTDDKNSIYLLSNNHVFANLNKAQPEDYIYQPGIVDGGTESDLVAKFHRTVMIDFSGNSANYVDAAIAKLDSHISYTKEICTIGKVNGTAIASESMKVKKHGRTSGYTEGMVTDVNYDTLVGMDHQDPGTVALFEDQIRIDKINNYSYFGLSGDSGSLVVNEANQAVGLYFAGASGYGLANPIGIVEEKLHIKLL